MDLGRTFLQPVAPIVLRCTEKLTRLLGLRRAGLTEPAAGPYSEWYANLLWLDRRKCVLFTHAETLFSFLVPDVLKADLANIGEFFTNHLEFELVTEELPLDCFGRLDHDAVHIAKTRSRSVLGSMNDLAFQCEHAVWSRGGLAETAVGLLNHRRGAERQVLTSESMPLWGTEADMQELMRRHEAEGMGAFKPDDSEVGGLFVETALPGGERWVAPCGCSVTIPTRGDPVSQPTFHPADDHLVWAGPTDREREVLAFLRAPMPRKPRRRRLFRQG